MALKIYAKDTYRVKAGKKIKLKAVISGWTDKNEKELEYSDDDGHVDDVGVFTAPQINVPEKKFVVEVVSVADSNVKHVYNVIVEKTEALKIQPSVNVMVFSGGEIHFTAKSANGDINPYWHIVDYTHCMGMIDAKNGKYNAPQVISTERDIKIEVLDCNTGNRACTILKLKPIEIAAGISGPQRINAGCKNAQLDIQSNFDLAGLYNYKCTIISVPKIGEIKDAGIYTPPLRIQNEYNIKVLAVSLTDPDKQIVYRFQLGYSLCDNCRKEIGPGNKCVSCGRPTAFSAYF